MTDLDLVRGAIAAGLRLRPDVARLYPTRNGLVGVVDTIGGLLDAVAEDPAVSIRSTADDGHVVEASVGLVAGTTARTAGAAIAAEVRRTAEAGGVAVQQVRVRIASID